MIVVGMSLLAITSAVEEFALVKQCQGISGFHHHPLASFKTVQSLAAVVGFFNSA
jgi:hypothetical protein